MIRKIYLVIGLLAVGLLLVCFLLGYTLSGKGSTKETKAVVITSSGSDETTVPAHETYEVPAGQPAPEIVEVSAIKDPKMGWNIEVKTKNFQFTPDNVNEPNIDGQGHAHLYIDGAKVTRLYSPFYFLSGYAEGIHEVKVVLNTNQHQEYAVNGKVVEATTKIVGDHSHANGETDNHSH